MTDRNTMADKKKTGVFGGAFNPIHNGHIALAESFLKQLELDRILFIPTADPPHKTGRFLASKEDRLRMLQLAVRACPKFEISDIEFQREGKSYTYDTLCRLKEDHPGDELYLIIGADQFLTFNRWYRYRDILDMARLCTAARENTEERQRIKDFAKGLDGLNEKNYYLSEGSVIKVSSSEIRQKIKARKDVSSLIPQPVYKYILEKRLYCV